VRVFICPVHSDEEKGRKKGRDSSSFAREITIQRRGGSRGTSFPLSPLRTPCNSVEISNIPHLLSFNVERKKVVSALFFSISNAKRKGKRGGESPLRTDTQEKKNVSVVI